jgi:pseudoazurin
MIVFDPAFVKIQPGDTIRFVPADKGHNAELIKGMAPECAPAFKTVVGKEETVTFEKPGLYGFKCGPHYIMKMVGLIQVGDKPENLEAAKAVQHGKRAAKRFEPLFETVE